MSTLSPFTNPYLRLLCLFLFSVCFSSLPAATFPVTSLASTGPGTLHDAITMANGSTGLDDITFTLAGTITLSTPLPTITSPVFINGGSAPGYVVGGAPLISINVNSVGGNGLTLLNTSGGSTIQGLNIHSASANGIILIGSGNTSIQGCYIGTNMAGTAAAPNGARGVQVEGAANAVTIGGPNFGEGNVISGNTQFGVVIAFSSNCLIAGNHIGTNATGTAVLGNGEAGIQLFDPTSSSNIVGGSTIGHRNIISGNGTGLSGNGINVDGASLTTIQGNYIGVDITGNVAMGNAENGISINGSTQTTIGGAGANEGNVIANHTFHAIVLNNGSNNTNIYGNIIGTNAAGTAAMGNDDSGVIVINTNNVNIGGSGAGEGNLLSGSLSEYGVFIITSTAVVVRGNKIGTDITGTLAIPNLDGGIRIEASSTNNTIGGLLAGEANEIGFNTGYGVGVPCTGCTGNLISGNKIFCNTGKGIDLNNLGNVNHPIPIIALILPTGASGTTTPNDIVELYYDDNCATPPCQGETYIGNVTADAVGAWSYTGAINVTQTLVALSRSSANNTSEFTCAVLLPIDLLYFEAEVADNGLPFLQWAVVDESQVDQIHIQRRNPGESFETIATQEGNGKSAFEFADMTAGQGTFDYRLQLMDFTGESSYSNIRTITLDASGPAYTVFPNPVENYIQFATRMKGDAKISLLNAKGMQVRNWNVSLEEVSERGSTQLEVAGLPGGYYYLSINRNGQKSHMPVFIR